MSKSKTDDQATHGGGKRSAEGQSSDANELNRGRPSQPGGPNSDPDDLGKADLERRAAAANREPAEGPRKKDSA
jgi:hypothetical protein